MGDAYIAPLALYVFDGLMWASAPTFFCCKNKWAHSVRPYRKGTSRTPSPTKFCCLLLASPYFADKKRYNPHNYQRHAHTDGDSASIYHHITEFAGASLDKILMELVGHSINKAETYNAKALLKWASFRTINEALLHSSF